jgi:hypothetical protein
MIGQTYLIELCQIPEGCLRREQFLTFAMYWFNITESTEVGKFGHLNVAQLVVLCRSRMGTSFSSLGGVIG